MLVNANFAAQPVLHFAERQKQRIRTEKIGLADPFVPDKKAVIRICHRRVPPFGTFYHKNACMSRQKCHVTEKMSNFVIIKNNIVIARKKRER